jgi:hypothetical protein
VSTIPDGELEAAVAARQELGRTHESEVVEAIAIVNVAYARRP